MNMKYELKRNFVSLVTIVLSGIIFTASAAPIAISDHLVTAPLPITTVATIADPDHFHVSSSLNLNFMGKEFSNSNSWSFSVNGATIANESTPVSALTIPALFDNASNTYGLAEVAANYSGWNFIETLAVSTIGHVSVTIHITNHTGFAVGSLDWTVGLNPDQGIPVGLGLDTHNVINGTGQDSSITASTSDGSSLTLANTTGAYGFSIYPLINPLPLVCCEPGNYGFSDSSIGLHYHLTGNVHGDNLIHNGDTVAFSYEYIMTVPEPKVFVMLLIGLGLIGFSLRHRKTIK